VQYVEDVKFWVLAAGNSHRLPDKEIVKMFVIGLKQEVFREEIYSRAFETLVDVMAETRHELANYRDIIEISERIKRPEPKKDAKDRIYPGPRVSRKQGFESKASAGASFAKEPKVSNTRKSVDLKDVECFKCHKKGHYANKCHDAKSKDGKGFFKVRQLEEPALDKKDEKSIRQIRIRHSDLNRNDSDPFLRYWIKVYDLAGPIRDALHPGYLAHVFVDTGGNCNTISRRFFDDLVGRGLVAEFIKGPNEGVRINLVAKVW